MRFCTKVVNHEEQLPSPSRRPARTTNRTAHVVMSLSPTTSAPSTPDPIPLTSPLRTYPKRLLPPTVASTYPHGHYSGHLRTPTQQAALEARIAEIKRTLSKVQIEWRYQDAAKRVLELLERIEGDKEAVEKEIEMLMQTRELERRVHRKIMEEKRGSGGG